MAAGEADESSRVLGEIIQRGCGLMLIAVGFAELDFGQQPAEVLIPFARFHQQRISKTLPGCYLGSHQRPYAGFLRGLMETHCAGEIVAVEKRDGGNVEIGALRNQGFGNRRAFQKTEG